MATVKTVSVKYGRKVNLGDFNSADVECQWWIDLDADEQSDLHNTMTRLWAAVKENVKAQVEGATRKPNMTIKEYYLGLPKADVELIQEITNANQELNGQTSSVPANR